MRATLTMHNSRNSSISSSFLSSLLLFLLLAVSSISMAASAPASVEEAKVHIVYTEKPQDEEPEAYHLRTLASVLGSDEAARDALVYIYKNAATGFSAKISKAQADEIAKLPGVLSVQPSRTLQLHSGTGRLN